VQRAHVVDEVRRLDAAPPILAVRIQRRVAQQHVREAALRLFAYGRVGLAAQRLRDDRALARVTPCCTTMHSTSWRVIASVTARAADAARASGARRRRPRVDQREDELRSCSSSRAKPCATPSSARTIAGWPSA